MLPGCQHRIAGGEVNMKNIVLFDEYRELDFKPAELIQTYLELVEKDVKSFFLNKGNLIECHCPGCLGNEAASSFNKFGLSYIECQQCHTLRISPRPSDDYLLQFYRESSARKFWRNELSTATQKKRREKIARPRYEWVSDSIGEYLPNAASLLDLNTNQKTIVEEISLLRDLKQKILLNPFMNIAEVEDSGIEIIEKPLRDLAIQNEMDIVTLFEVPDRTSDVESLFKIIHQILRRNGLCFITAILISGLDLQVLWNTADNLFPPDRLNVFSVEGFQALFERHGFECIEFSTPGILDVDIIARNIAEKPTVEIPRFIKYMIQNRSPETKKAFQEFLEANLLSSYGRILIRKK
jgi:hypothetical protein